MRNWGKLVIAALALLASPALAQRPPSNEELADRGYVVDGGHQASWYYAQHKKLDAAIAALKPQRPGVVDAYVIAVGLDADAVFGREAAEASRVLSPTALTAMGERFCWRRAAARLIPKWPMARRRIWRWPLARWRM